MSKESRSEWWTRTAARIKELDPYAQQIVLEEIERLIEVNRERKRLGRDPDATIN